MRNQAHKTAQKGYSLFELVLVLLIASVVLVGVVRLLSTLDKSQKYQIEKTELATIKSAIIQFAIQNGRLPCPDTNGDGRMERVYEASSSEVRSCGVTGLNGNAVASADDQKRVVVGYLPYKDLGVAGQNRYGRRFQYVVTLHYADLDANTSPLGRFKDPTPMPTQQAAAVYQAQSRCSNPPVRSGQLRPSFSACSKGGVALAEVDLQGNLTTLYDDVPFAVVSLGKNGTDAPTQYEQKNIKSITNGSVVFNNTNTHNTQNEQNRVLVVRDVSDVAFDDQVIWETSGILALHLLEAGVLP